MPQETKIEPRSKALAYELMGVLAEVDHAGISAFDWVCYHTVKRVMEELLGGSLRPAMPEDVPDLVKALRTAVLDEYAGTLVPCMDDLTCRAADALEAAYGVSIEGKQC